MIAKRAVIYARYSSINQNEQSIDGQIKDCQAFAERAGIDVVGVYADKAQTGTNDNRADFQRMLKDAEKHIFEHIIVWKIDRFGRNREEITLNKIRCRKHNVSVLYAMEHIPDGASGVLYESLLEGMAEYYSKNLSENVKRGMRDNALKCKCNGGGRLLGYTTDEDKNLVIDPTTAEVVKRIFLCILIIILCPK